MNADERTLERSCHEFFEAFQRPARIPWIAPALGLLAVAAFFAPGIAEGWQYDRAALARGEWTRWIACHWTHWTGSMLFWDGATFIALGAVCERLDRRRFLLGVGAAALAIPAAVWVFEPEIELYRGLSGVESALVALLFALLSALLLRRAWEAGNWRWSGLIVLANAAFVGKTAFELLQGATLFADIGAGIATAPLTHVAGLLAGYGAGMAPMRDAAPSPWRGAQKRRSSPVEAAASSPVQAGARRCLTGKRRRGTND
jgi:hypothetical protein